jgi:hypothetical protein
MFLPGSPLGKLVIGVMVVVVAGFGFSSGKVGALEGRTVAAVEPWLTVSLRSDTAKLTSDFDEARRRHNSDRGGDALVEEVGDAIARVSWLEPAPLALAGVAGKPLEGVRGRGDLGDPTSFNGGGGGKGSTDMYGLAGCVVSSSKSVYAPSTPM